jgi:hypothetical protein
LREILVFLPEFSNGSYRACAILPQLTWQTLPMMRDIAIVPMRGRCRECWRRVPAAKNRITKSSRSSLVNNNRKFRAVQRIGLAGVFGAVLMLVAENASSQTVLEATDPSAAKTEETPPEKRVVLKFFNTDWATVLNKVAEQSGSTAVMHEVPPGLYNRRDKTEYTRHEAVQILNHELEPEGFRILEKNQFLIVVHQRSLRTRYRRPETPTQPEWQPDPAAKRQFETSQKPKRSVTPIATRDSQPPGHIQLAGDTKPVPAPVPAVMAQAPTTAAQTPATNPIAMQEAPPAPTELPAGWTFTTLSPRNNVRDLAGSLY